MASMIVGLKIVFILIVTLAWLGVFKNQRGRE